MAIHFGDIDALAAADIEELSSVPEVGDKIAIALRDYFDNPRNIEEIRALQALGLPFKHQAQQSSQLLEGLSFLITGTLNHYGRKEMEELIQSHGGKILSSVSKQLDYLIVGDKAGSKLTKAQKMGKVKIIDEEAFLDMLEKPQ